jgi:hypothetical protein
MSLTDVVETVNSTEATLTVVNPESECPLYRLLSGLFDDEVVTVRETTSDAETIPADTVFVERDDGKAGGVNSQFDDLRDELLLVNADIYVTGARGLDDVETPDVITQLSEIPFTVRGRPEDAKEKFLLIEMSRHIEAMAWRAGDGRLATGFQQLSRLDDEHGTRQVYTRLGTETDVEAHVYGIPDARPSLPGVRIHGDHAAELRRTWFVVYESRSQPDNTAALVAVQTDPNTWEGCWTYDPATVTDILAYLDRAYR